jgi:hypothetical protein
MTTRMLLLLVAALQFAIAQAAVAAGRADLASAPRESVVTARMVDDAHRLMAVDFGANGYGQWAADPRRRGFYSFYTKQALAPACGYPGQQAEYTRQEFHVTLQWNGVLVLRVKEWEPKGSCIDPTGGTEDLTARSWVNSYDMSDGSMAVAPADKVYPDPTGAIGRR